MLLLECLPPLLLAVQPLLLTLLPLLLTLLALLLTLLPQLFLTLLLAVLGSLNGPLASPFGLALRISPIIDGHPRTRCDLGFGSRSLLSPPLLDRDACHPGGCRLRCALLAR